ncbi:hypothetical protein ACHAPT_000183 [Fusarium lateritium]
MEAQQNDKGADDQQSMTSELIEMEKLPYPERLKRVVTLMRKLLGMGRRSRKANLHRQRVAGQPGLLGRIAMLEAHQEEQQAEMRSLLDRAVELGRRQRAAERAKLFDRVAKLEARQKEHRA